MKRSLLVLFVTVFIISIGNVFGQTTVSDTLQSDDTWELGNSPYQVTSDVIVASGVTLTIEPGVEVQFDSGTSLIVNGALDADGTDAQNILFTSSSGSPSPGDWVTVRFTNTSDVGSVIDHAIFEYGGEGTGGSLVSYATGAFGFDITNSEFRFSNKHGIDLRASSPFIQHSVFRDNNGYGIFSDLALNYEVDSSKVIRNSQGGVRVPINATPTITATTIDTNGVGIYMDNGSTAEVKFNNIRANDIGIRVIEAGNNSPLIEDNTFGGNSNWALINEGPDPVEAEYNYWGEPTGPTAISNPTGTGDDVSSNVDFDPWLSGSGTLPVKEITQNPSDDDVWSADTVYVIANGITLAEFDTLTIAPGTAVKFENQVSFNIDGTLIADGKPDSVIVFTSLKSDIYGGDTNQDARNSKPSPGDWRGLDLTDFNTGSIFDYVNISYAGYSNTPALEVSQNNVSLSNMFLDNNNDVGIQISGVPMVFQNIVSNANNSHGIEMRNITADLDSVEASFNQGNGLYYESDADNTGATLSISRSVFNENNGDGIFIDDQGFGDWTNQPALDSLTNSEISFNGRHGLNIEQGWGSSIYIANNTFEGNSKHGATIYHVTAFEDSNRVHNNEFIGNGKTGIRTTSARFSDNTFDGNEFGIGYWGRLGYSFLNDADQDNNSFTNNTYNNALELYANQLRDTLAKDFPEDITSNVFMFNDIGTAISDGDEMVIEPGVIIKIGHAGSNNDFRVDDATLIAKGTDSDPIVFTSYRDHSWGGKTNALSDTNSAKSHDWRELYLLGNEDPTNTKFTELEHVIFQYGDRNIRTFFSGDNSIQNTWSHIESRFAHEFIEFQNILVTLENATIEDHRREGIRLENRSNGGQAEITLRNSIVRNNGEHGIQTTGYFAPNAIIREMSNSVIEGNGQDGVRSPNGRSPMTFQFNSIHHNGGNGIYATVSEAGTDTVLTISGNSILHNGGTGILSSRAIIVDDTLQHNQIPIGVTGELSKSGTVNSEGNFYRDNVITDNVIDSVISVTGNVNGILGGSWPEGYTRTVLVGNSSNSDIDVNSGDSLVVSPGTIFKGRNNNDIDIEGTLLSIGDKDNKIIFTSFKDDTFGGNTNRDTTDVIPEPGDWRGFDISDAGSDSSRIKNTIIRYADDNLYLRNTEVVIDSSFVSYADHSGIHALNGANPIIRSSDIHHNDVGIEIDNNANPFIHLNNIYDNGTAIHQDGNTDVIAEFNYWGASTGPFVDTGPDQNLSGTGNEIYIQDGTVDYRPFHTGRNGILLGDVTENGSITAFDASLVLQHTVGSNNLTGNALAAADVSANGSVSAMDASYILQFVVGNISGFPGQGKRVTYDYNNALTLSYEGTPEETDISIQNTGEAPVQALEMDIVIPENPVQKVELVDTPAETNMNLEFSIRADTIRIAMACWAKTFDEAQSIGTLRLIHAKDSKVERLDEIISYDEFIVNETAVTEHMNEVYTSSEEIAGVPEKFDLKQNYPNPFNPTTNIAYDLPQPGEVKLQVYNMLGQLVQTVTDKRQKAGSYSVKWDASRYSSGTYLLRIEFTGEDNTSYSQVRKMLLIK